jgi:hypothetical protein
MSAPRFEPVERCLFIAALIPAPVLVSPWAGELAPLFVPILALLCGILVVSPILLLSPKFRPRASLRALLLIVAILAEACGLVWAMAQPPPRPALWPVGSRAVLAGYEDPLWERSVDGLTDIILTRGTEVTVQSDTWDDGLSRRRTVVRVEEGRYRGQLAVLVEGTALSVVRPHATPR